LGTYQQHSQGLHSS